MKIAVIGGGISGLYISHLLKNKHQVTIFEKENWGGDVQTEYIDGKCYPISTLFVIPSDNKELKNQLKKLNIKTSKVSLPLIVYISIYIIFATIAIIGIVKTDMKAFFVFILCLTIFVSIFHILYYRCKLILSFGANKNCKFVGKFSDIFNINYLFSSLEYPENCGFSRIIESFYNDKDINYVNRKVSKIIRNKSYPVLVLENNETMTFDKCIIACDYNNYKSILSLTDKEKDILSNTEYFDYYSTLIKFHNTKPKPKIYNSLGKFKVDHGVYIYGSQEPLIVTPKNSYSFKKTYKWSMPVTINLDKKQKINNEKNRNIFFIGKEIAGNAVGSCMKYAKIVSNII